MTKFYFIFFVHSFFHPFLPFCLFLSSVRPSPAHSFVRSFRRRFIKVRRATFFFNLSRNIVVLQDKCICCAYYHVCDQLVEEKCCPYYQTFRFVYSFVRVSVRALFASLFVRFVPSYVCWLAPSFFGLFYR